MLRKLVQRLAVERQVEKLVQFLDIRDRSNPVRKRLDQLFNDTAEEQYEKKLLFSTVMNLMLHVTQKNSPSLRQSYLSHRNEIPASLSAVYQKINNLDRIHDLKNNHCAPKKRALFLCSPFKNKVLY